MTYSIVATRTVALSNGIQLIIGLTNPDLMISLIASEPVTEAPAIERIFKEGNVFRVRWTQGEKKGGLIPLSYGDRELILDIPDTSQPFNLELMPSRLQFSYTVQVFSRELTQEQINFATQLALPVSALNGINNQLIEILVRINNMAASDIRSASLTQDIAVELDASAWNSNSYALILLCPASP